jgi:CRISPR-associated protein Cas2
MNDKFMRLIAMFDLPVKTKKQVKEANTFRKFLIKDGYHMIQFSVYGRVCNGQDSIQTHKTRLKCAVPKQGSIRVLTITEKQYCNIDIMLGKREKFDEDTNYDLISFF